MSLVTANKLSHTGIGRDRMNKLFTDAHIEAAIRYEVEEDGANCGYRLMWKRLRTRHYMAVYRYVMLIVVYINNNVTVLFI
jgi:hypothetical protein